MQHWFNLLSVLSCFLLFFCPPLPAQKNLLPAAKAAVGKTPFQTAVSGGAVRALEPYFLAKRIAAAGAAVQQPQAGSIVQTVRQAAAGQPSKNAVRQAYAKQLAARSAETLKKPVESSFGEVVFVWQEGVRGFANDPLFRHIFAPTLFPTVASLKGNRRSLVFSRELLEKAIWFKAHKNAGKKHLKTVSSPVAVKYLASHLSRKNLVMLGEIHHYPSVHQTVGDLLLQLKADNPGRRIVLFTEFVDLPGFNPGSHNTMATYYRRMRQENLPPATLKNSEFEYATRLFLRLLKAKIEIYPLEDPVQQKVFAREMFMEEDSGVFMLTERNKSWARTIAAKMVQIRQTDPDALFVVYAGLAHTSWIMPMSLPKFFAPEDPYVVEITQEYPSDFTTLRLVWGEYDSFFESRGKNMLLYRWTGGEARLLGRQTGFDFALIVPDNEKTK